MSEKPSFFAELKRRNVLRAGAFYATAAWLIVQVITQVGPVFDLPPTLQQWVVVALAIGFPVWLVFAWFYELTPEGLKRESEIDRSQPVPDQTGRHLNVAIVGVLAVAVVLLLADRLVLRHGAGSGKVELAPARSPAAPAAGVSMEALSIAVLPFVNMSDDRSNEYFSDGISEELLNLLAAIPQLQVTARTSSFSFKGKDTAIPEIARQLHVAHVLEGSVRKAGNSVRISAQLIEARSGTEMWSKTWNRKLDDIFAIQDEIAADVVRQLKVTMLGDEPKARTTDPESYAYFLQAMQLRWLRTAQAYEQSDALFIKALAIDPNYAPAWAGLAGNFANRVNLGLLSAEVGNAKAREAATKALAIDERYAPAHARLGLIALYGDNDLAAAAKHFQRALELDPWAPNVLSNYALLLQSLGRLDEALAIAERVLRRDPLNVPALFNLGVYQRYSGRFDAAAATYRTVLSLVPGRGNAHAELGSVLLLQGDAHGALAEIEQETSASWKMYGLPMALHALGRQADADAALTELIKQHEKDSPYNIAYVHAFVGDADQAFAWLDKAAEYNDSGLADIASENLFDKVRADPRWLPFLRRIGKAPEQLAQIELQVSLPGGD